MKIVDACGIWEDPEYRMENRIRENEWQIGFWDGVEDVLDKLRDVSPVNPEDTVVISVEEYRMLGVLYKMFKRLEKENRGKNDMMAQMFATFRDITGAIFGVEKPSED